MSVCRICGNHEYQGSPYSKYEKKLIKYSTRHYAHTSCGLEKWGAGFFDRLTPWQCENLLPYTIVSKLGFKEAFEARINSKEPTLKVKNSFMYQVQQDALRKKAMEQGESS